MPPTTEEENPRVIDDGFFAAELSMRDGTDSDDLSLDEEAGIGMILEETTALGVNDANANLQSAVVTGTEIEIDIVSVAHELGQDLGFEAPEEEIILEEYSGLESPSDVMAELQHLREQVEEQAREMSERDEEHAKQLAERDRQIAERDRKVEEQARALRECNRQLAVSNNGNRSLPAILRDTAEDLSLRAKAMLVFMAGFLAYEPPLWFNPNMVLRQMGCRRFLDIASSPRNAPPPTTRQRIRAGMRLAFFLSMFLMDFSDSMCDFTISIRDMMGLSLDDPSDDDAPRFVWWGVWLFLATAVGRTLGGLFAVFYHRIDKSDREMTYLVVELTIWCVEDVAALHYLQMKQWNGVEWTRLEYANYYLTNVCGFVFGVPTLCRWKSITKALPRAKARLVLMYYAIGILWMLYVNFIAEWHGNLSVSQFVLYTRVLYSITVPPQLYMLYQWVRYLQKKENARQQEEEKEDIGFRDLTLVTEKDDIEL